ncbi:MAG TPA: DUF4395 family protein [Candidatus Krumholzibacteria bacterium]
MSARLNFVRQQGFADATAQSCGVQFGALVFQPRAMLVLAVLGLLLETGWYFVGLGLVLLWGALVPRWNVFDLAYAWLVSRRRGLPPPMPAPAPRRFAQFLAGLFALGSGLAALAGHHHLAWRLLGLLFLAIAGIVFARFCMGSYLFHLVTGRAAYAHRTMPWSREES